MPWSSSTGIPPAIKAPGGPTSVSVVHRNNDQLQDTRNSTGILFQTAKIIPLYLQENQFPPD